MPKLRSLCGWLAVIIAPALLAQTDSGSIRGTVSDSTRAAVPAVTITAREISTGVVKTTMSEAAGNFTLANLRAGTYTVTAEREGFKSVQQNNVKVDVAVTVALDLELPLGSTTDRVTVTAEVTRVASESSEQTTAIQPKPFIDLPLNASGGRSAESFILLTPGVTGASGFGGAYVNGGARFTREIQVDGMSLTTAEVGGDERQMTYAPEAIQEFSIATTGYAAEFGNTGGGVERFTVRSGTNQYRGNFYEYLRNDKLDARGFFNRTVSVNRQNEFGGSIGGPVRIPKVYNGTNRTFFFLNINEFRFRSGPDNSIASVPTEAFKQGDFSAWRGAGGALIPIYDPASTRPDGAGGFTRDAFPGNVIPAGRISPASRRLVTYFPNAVLPNVTNNFPSVMRTSSFKYAYTGKIDHNFSELHRLSLSYNYAKQQDNAAGLSAPLPPPMGGRVLYHYPINHNVRLSYDWTLSARTLNHFSAGLTRQDQFVQSPTEGGNWGSVLGIANLPNGAFPQLNYAPFTSPGTQGMFVTINNTFMVADAMTLVRGKHTLKFGFDFRRLQNNFRANSATGTFSFSPNETAFPTAAGRSSTGLAFASMLLGQVDSGTITVRDITNAMRIPYFAAYVQDDYKVTRRLTLNLGLRWDLFLPILDANDNYSIMDPTVPNPAAGGRLGAMIFAGDGPGRVGRRRLLDQVAYKNFGPRLGLAYSVSPRMAFRMAYGVSYYPTGGLGGGNTKPTALGFLATPVYTSGDLGITPAFQWDNGFPTNWVKPPIISPTVVNNTNTTMWGDAGYRPSYHQEWNAGIQYDLGQGWVADVSYVGNKSTRLPLATNRNQVNPSFLNLGNLLTQQIGSPAVTAAGFNAPYPGFTGSLAQALRPFPQYLTVGTSSSDVYGFGNHNSLQIKVEKRLSKGLFVLASYVWAKTLTNVNSDIGGGVSLRDNYNYQLNKSLATYDVPSRFVSAVNYELPFGPGKSFLKGGGVTGKLVGGWQINSIMSYASGEPLLVSVANSLPLFNSLNLPNVNPAITPRLTNSGFDPAKNLALDINAFSIPPAFTFGNASSVLPNARAFPNFNENFGIIKRTYFTERVNLEFRFEMFNAFNRVRFGNPAANVSEPVNFGKVTSQSNAPRQGQFALKLNF